MIFTKFIFLKKNRLPIVLYNSLYSVSGLLWTVLISFFVIKKTSVSFWGEFMTIVAIITFGNHLVKWGNKTYLLKEFSSKPSRIKEIWNTVFVARIAIYFLVSIISIWYYFNNFKLLFFILFWILSDFIFSSLEAHIAYFKKFKSYFILEIILITVALSVISTSKITLILLITIYTLRILIKAVFGVILFKKNLKLNIKLNSIKLLNSMLPFFVIGLIGLLNSKLDFYATLYFLNDDQVGKYHILSNFILFGITLASYIIIPFEKNIYRLHQKKVTKLSLNFLILGVFISCVWMFLSKKIISQVYKIDFPIIIYFIGFIYILPIYYYWPILHKLYAKNKINTTLIIGLISVLANAIFIVLLVPKLELIGIMISAVIAQLIQLIGYLFVYKKS